MRPSKQLVLRKDDCLTWHSEAEQNKIKFGRSKADRAQLAAEAERARRQLDGAQLPAAANEAGFSTFAAPDDDDLDPGNVS